MDFNFQIPSTGEFCLSELKDSKDGVLIKLDVLNSTKKVKILFSSVFSYRYSGESFRLVTLSKLPARPIIQCVGDSEYLRWFHSESQELYKDLKLQHYLIITADDVIDVISDVEPIVTEA